MKLICAVCWAVSNIPIAIFEQKRKAGLPLKCSGCLADLMKVGSKPPKSTLPDSQRRSREQEKRTATREGGKRQPASGSISGYEGDTRVVGKYRGENKLTRADSYRLKLADLQKLETQATCGEFPIFDIEFQGGSLPKRYVVMPEWVYETLMCDSGRRHDEGARNKNPQ